MADKQIIDCEYSNVDEMRTCKAFDVSVHGDIICKEEDCIILKLKQQLKAKEQECEELRQVRKDLPDIQMPYVILYRQLKAQYYKLEQECEKLKEENNTYKSSIAANLDKSISKRYRELLEQLDQLKAKNKGLKLLNNRLNSALGYRRAGKKTFIDLSEELDQLKAKEQECEKLKEEQAEIKKYLGISHKTILERLKELTEFRDRDRDEYYNSKQECEKLKEEIKTNGFGCFNIEMSDQLKRAEQKLEKIKEIVSNDYAIFDLRTTHELLQIIEGKENG